MAPTEANFDGLVGPTHNYAGLSWGNVASSSNQGAPSNPRAAALQGLAKMKYLADLGLPQGVLPPQERPHVGALRALGFEGSDQEVVARTAARAPLLLALTSSASSMWAANAATVAPSADTADGRVHFTPANLSATFHRSLEPDATARALRRIFSDQDAFVVHDPVPGGGHLGDEGAANHTRLHAPGAPDRGAHLFVYGRTAFGGSERRPSRYPARQAFEASQAVARLHRLDPERTFFVQQRPEVIDEGVFHNDVIAVGNGPVLFHHEEAFAGDGDPLEPLDRALDGGLVRVMVSSAEARVEEVVRSYLFNSQLVTLPDGTMALVAPIESRESDATRRVVERVVRDENNPIAAAHFLDVRESMRNGGGPACLRLRVPLEDRERAAVHEGCWLDDTLFARLTEWVERHYRDRLSAADLADPKLRDETREALDQLTEILNIGSIYPFQLV